MSEQRRDQRDEGRDASVEDEPSGIANRTGPGSDPEPTPERGEAKEGSGTHGEQPRRERAS